MTDEERFRNGVRDVLLRSKNVDSEEIDEEQISEVLDGLLEEDGPEKIDEMIRDYRRRIILEIADQEGEREKAFDGADTLSLERDECVIPSCDREGELRSLDDYYTEFEDDHLKVTLCKRHLDELKEAEIE